MLVNDYLSSIAKMTDLWNQTQTQKKRPLPVVKQDNTALLNGITQTAEAAMDKRRAEWAASPSPSFSIPVTKTPIKATGGSQGFNNDLSAAFSRSSFPAEWAGALTELVRRESSFNPNAKNPKSTAYGYAQFLNSTRANYEKKTGLSYNDPVNQLVMMMQYVKDRYGTPQAALNFWDKNKWY
jgi:hypothetical protein